MALKPELRVFVSSPGDVAEERAQTEQVLLDLAKAYSRYAQLNAVFWEHEPLFLHAGFQDQLPLPSECDLVIILLWSRIGTRLPASYSPEPGALAPTGTEFEIRDALAAHRQRGRPELLVYLKTATVMAGLDEDGTPERVAQIQRLRAFVTEAFHDAGGAGISAYHPFKDTAAFVAMLRRHVETWLKQQLAKRKIDGAVRSWTSGSPFRGLNPFDAEHRAVYFGRSVAISAVLGQLREREKTLRETDAGLRFLIVHGLSGNGKSSLIRAGVLPLLGIGALDGVGLIRQASMRPASAGGDVFVALVQALQAALPELGQQSEKDTRALASELAAGAEGAPLVIRSVVSALAKAHGLELAQVRVVLLVDQLEELFTSSSQLRTEGSPDPDPLPSTERAGRALAAFARSGFVWIVATLRSDFMHHLERSDAWRAISRNAVHFTLHKPTGDELGEMVREPARVAGLRFEERGGLGLDRRLIEDASQNTESLPLVEFVLDELWKRYDSQPSNEGELRHADYEALGGLNGALECAADAALACVPGSDADRLVWFRNVMRQLVRIGEGDSEGKALRRDAALDGFAPGSGERNFVDALIAARLCVTDAPRLAVPTVRIAHEALLSSWSRVQGWVQHDAELLRIRDRLLRDADEWQRHGQPKDLLAYGGKRLDEVRTVHESGMPLSDAVTAYISRSQERAARQRLGRVTAVVGLLLVAVSMSVLAVLALRSRQQERVRFVEAAALQLAADAKANFSLRGDEDKGIRQLLAARSLGSAISFENDFYAALAHQMTAAKAFADRPAVTALRYAADGNRLFSAHVDGSLRFWNPHTRQELRVVEAHTDAINALVLTADGTRVFTASDDGTIRQWSALSGENIGTAIEVPSSRLLSLVLDASDTRVVAAADDGTIRIWNLADGRLVAGPISAHRGEVRGAVLIPGSIPRFATTGQDGVTRVWAFDGAAVGAPMKIATAANAIAANPGGREVAVGDDEGTITLWSLETGRESRPPLRGHIASVTALTYSADGLRLASGSVDQTVRMWEPDSTGEPRTLGDSGGFVRSAVFSPDSARVAVGGSGATLHTWDSRPQGSMSVGIALEREAMITAVFSPTSDSMLTYADGFDGFTGFRLWDSRTGRLICRMPGDYTLLAGLKFDPTGRQVVALRAAPASTTASGQGAADAFVMAFWDAKNCTRLEREIRIEILEGEDTFASFGFFESGRTLAVKVGERRLLYDATTLQTHPAQQIVPAAPPPGLALLEDAEESSAGSEDPLSVRARHGDHAVVDVDGAPHTYLKHGERIVIDFGLEIVKAAFSPDGKSLVLSTDGVTHLMPAPSVWSQRLCAMLGERPTEDSLKDLRPEDIAYVDPCTP